MYITMFKVVVSKNVTPRYVGPITLYLYTEFFIHSHLFSIYNIMIPIYIFKIPIEVFPIYVHVCIQVFLVYSVDLSASDLYR